MIFILSYLFVLRALAADSDYCMQLEKLKARVVDCSQNAYYAKAAMSCVEKIDARAAGVLHQRLEGNLKAHDTASTSAQDSKFNNTHNDLHSAEQTTSQISSEITRARVELQRYLHNLTWPGPLSDAQVQLLHIAGVLATIPCYSDNQKLVEQQLAQLDTRAHDIAVADAELGKLKGGVKNGSTNLRGSARNVRSTKGQGAGETLAAPEISNTITGSFDDPKLPSP